MQPNRPDPPRTMTREDSIRRIRGRLKELVDENHSICDVAAHCGVLCRGFAQWSDEKLQEVFGWLHAPGMPRETLEARANAYLLGRTEALEQELACDAQQLEHDLCRGWDGFSDQDLARFQLELFAEEVRVQST